MPRLVVHQPAERGACRSPRTGDAAEGDHGGEASRTPSSGTCRTEESRVPSWSATPTPTGPKRASSCPAGGRVAGGRWHSEPVRDPWGHARALPAGGVCGRVDDQQRDRRRKPTETAAAAVVVVPGWGRDRRQRARRALRPLRAPRTCRGTEEGPGAAHAARQAAGVRAAEGARDAAGTRHGRGIRGIRGLWRLRGSRGSGGRHPGAGTARVRPNRATGGRGAASVSPGPLGGRHEC